MALTTIDSSAGAVRGRVERQIQGGRLDIGGRLFELALVLCLLISLAVLALLIAEVVGNGTVVYDERGFDFLDGGLSQTASRAGIAQGLIGSFWIAVSVVVVAVPLGIGAAIYLEE